MGDDTDWLKKNPVGNSLKLGLRRSNRFYGHDMDGSIMTHEEKSNNQVLVVSHIRRRSNIPIEKRKQMEFKIPAPVLKKSAGKKPVTRISKFQVSQPVSRASVFSTPNSKNGLEQEKPGKESMRLSLFCGSTQPSASAITSSEVAHEMPEVHENANQSGVQDCSDVSLFSQSKIVNQSTPNEPAILRGILKQSEISKRHSHRMSSGRTVKAAKRVNFNANLKNISSEKNTKSLLKEYPSPGNLETRISVKTAGREERGLSSEVDDESIDSFSKSFKPISQDEGCCEEPEKNLETDKNNLSNCEDGNSTPKFKNSGSGDESKVFNSIVDMWQVYRTNVNQVRAEIQSNDDNFRRMLDVTSNSDLQNKFSVYQTEKREMYQRLQKLEEDFMEQMRNVVDVKTIFSNYLERKENVFRVLWESEEDFNNVLQNAVKKYIGHEIHRSDALNTNSAVKNVESVREETGNVKSISSRKRKSGSLNCSKMKTMSQKRKSKEMTSVAGSTPDNTPGRRKALSKKIEKQIRILFEE